MSEQIDYSIPIPSINVRYEYAGQPSGSFKRDVTNAINKLRSNYAWGIANASKLTGLPPYVIIAFSVIENTSANPSLVSSSGAIGLMQLIPSSAAYILSIQKGLSAEEVSFIKKYLPNAFDSNGSIKSELALRGMVKASTLTNPDFNLYCGSLMLLKYMKDSKINYGQYRLDHAIYKYNSGIGHFNTNVANAGGGNADTLTLVKQYTPYNETKNYIYKVMGVDGSLHILRQMGLA